MPTLHNTTEETKTIIKWGSIFIGIILVLLIGLRIGKNLKDYFYPAPPPAPTVSFGSLPAIQFPKNSSNNNFIYSLNTLLGTLPVFPGTVNIYSITNFEPNLLGTKRAQEKASKMGFNSQGQFLSNILHEWSGQTLPSRKLVMDVSSFNFTLSSDFFSDSDTINGKNLPNETESIDAAKSFLEDIELYASDINESKTKTTLLSIKDKTLTLATSFSTAQAIRVDFFQQDKDLPIYYPNPPFSSLFVLVGGNQNNRILSANFHHYNINSSSGTYPIKTAEEAFKELKNGKAYIASYYGISNEIAIDKVFLGYYLGNEKQNFLMPIIIFEGSNGFYAYVQAVKDQWIIK